MRTVILFITLLGSVQIVTAQRMSDPLWTSESDRSTVGAFGYGSIVSKQVSNRFVNQLFRSDFLKDELIEQQGDRLSESDNRVGGDYIIGLQGRVRLKGDVSLNFSLTDEAFAEAIFPKDIYTLAFNGNKQFAGDTVRFDGAFGRTTRFQKFGLGLSFTSGIDTRYGFLVSFLNAESSFSGQLDQAWLYTSNIGDTVSAGVLGQAFYSDTSNVGFLAHNGGGAAVDIFLEQEFQAWNSDWTARLMLMNFGMIQWHPTTERYRADTITSFSGITINDLSNAQAQANSASLEDSLLGAIRSGYFRSPVNQVLPAWVQLRIRQDKEVGFVTGIGFTARLQSVARVYGHVLPGYRFANGIGVDLELGYGGFGGFQFGLGGQWRREKWAAQLRLSNLESLIMPERFGGFTAAGGVQYFFEL